MAQKTAIIIGAGPAGLTAAFELLDKTDIKPIIFEQSSDIGGISKTINYKGNRIDIGGHRFFSKSDRVMKFWLDIIPLQSEQEKDDDVMLLRRRISRIFFMRKFFDYPISLTIKTVFNLGLLKTFIIGLSYIKAKVFKIKKEKSLEDFFITRFGKALYKTFFKDYTEKVWGVSCDKIQPEWGAQRIKGLSIARAIKHAVKAAVRRDASIGQKEIETSLISQFLYPKFGPGQLWEKVAEIVKSKGGQIYLNHKVVGVENQDNRIVSLKVRNEKGKFKTMAASELEKIGIIEQSDVLDSVVIRIEKTYPAYFGSFSRFDVIRNYTDSFDNLFLIGRNGMHRYNNQDHSMLTAMTAVENIVNGITAKDNIWQVNSEEDYHEMKLTAIENLSNAYAQTEKENLDYDPDVYWTDTGVAYPYYPTVRHRKRFVIDELKKEGVDSETFIFDYGCGEGGILSEIKTVFSLADNQLAGCDISAKAVEIAKQKIKSRHLYTEVFPKLTRKCDFIICSEVIEHTKDYFHILNWIEDNLTDDGRLILTTQAGKVHASDRYTGHTQHFEIAHLNAVLKHLGFEIEESRLWGFPFFTLQKYLTNMRFEKIRQNYLEGELTLRKKIVFEIANILFYLHDFIKSGPQIYIVARKK